MSRIVIISPRDARPPLESTSFRIRMSLYGVIAVGSFLETRGHSVRIFCELSGSKVNWSAVRDADYVCFSFLSFSAARAYRMADRVRTEFGKPVIMAGSHPSVMPEDALEHGDYVVRNEGEAAMQNLLEALEQGRDPSTVPGISYHDAAGRPVHNPDQDFNCDLSVPLNMDLVPDFRSRGLLWSLRDALANGMPRVPMPVVQASRGCPENCRFCVVKHQLGSRYRRRPMEVVLADIDSCLKIFKSPYILFVDNDLSLDPEFSRDLFQKVLDRYGPGLRPYIFCRIQVYKHHEFLRVMEQFDHATIGIGVESIHDRTLRDMNKGQDLTTINTSLAALAQYRISVNGLFIFGGEYDTPESIRKTVDFCIEKGFFSVGLFAIYDFPTRSTVLGQPQMIPDHHFIHRDWRFFNLNFAVNYPRLMRPSRLQEEIISSYRRFTDHSPESMVNFLPTRSTIKAYLEYLRREEDPYYDAHDRRIDEKLEGRTIHDLAREVPLHVPAAALYAETARFLTGNLFRGVTWKLLKGILSPARGPEPATRAPWTDSK